MVRRSLCCLVAALVSAAALHAQAPTPGEVRAERVLEAAKKAGNPELYALLKTMPKGADLHMHLSGAVYAETFIEDAARDGLCVAAVDPGTPAVPGRDRMRFASSRRSTTSRTTAPQVRFPSPTPSKTRRSMTTLVDSFSMRAFVADRGHQRPRSVLRDLRALRRMKDHSGEWLDEVATRAAAQNEQYLEIMQTPTFSHAA